MFVQGKKGMLCNDSNNDNSRLIKRIAENVHEGEKMVRNWVFNT